MSRSPGVTLAICLAVVATCALPGMAVAQDADGVQVEEIVRLDRDRDGADDVIVSRVVDRRGNLLAHRVAFYGATGIIETELERSYDGDSTSEFVIRQFASQDQLSSWVSVVYNPDGVVLGFDGRAITGNTVNTFGTEHLVDQFGDTIRSETSMGIVEGSPPLRVRTTHDRYSDRAYHMADLDGDGTYEANEAGSTGLDAVYDAVDSSGTEAQ